MGVVVGVFVAGVGLVAVIWAMLLATAPSEEHYFLASFGGCALVALGATIAVDGFS